MTTEDHDAKTTPEKAGDDEKINAATRVVELALDTYELGRTSDGVLFGVPADPRMPRVMQELKSLRPILSRALWDQARMTVRPTVMAAAMETLTGIAAGAPVSTVYIRAAEVGASVHLDLAERSGLFVEVSAHGWEVRDPRAENDPEATRPIFRRTAAMASGALPEPERGGSRDDLRRLLGLDADDPRWRLIWGWLVASLFESVPRPILWVLGPQGSGKSTRARMAMSVVEPVEQLGREPGKNERDDTTSAMGRYIPSYDNISTVSAATSDWLCRLVTGVEVARRALFSDDDLRVGTMRRTAVATSIVLPFGLGPDAIERLVLVELERVAEADRRPERDLWEEFRRLHPRILGALLDDVAGVLRHLGEVRSTSRPLPRMADYAQLLYALDIHAGEPDDDGYAAAYIASVTEVLADRAKDDPLTAALLKQAKRHGGTWRGNSSTLLAAIEADRPDDPRAPWPTSAASLGSAIRRGQETLRAAGLIVTDGRTKAGRWVRLELAPEEVGDDLAPEEPTNVVPLRPKADGAVPTPALDLAEALNL